mgnify:CR=1 FL=1
MPGKVPNQPSETSTTDENYRNICYGPDCEPDDSAFGQERREASASVVPTGAKVPKGIERKKS